MGERCACPRWDAYDCIEARYGLVEMDAASAEPCACACHERPEEGEDGR